ncbi:chromosome partitioning protein ParB [Leptospira barantonii]|uniref:Chromosome partitioning protein ParB n=1 Tax=Leptospira barantonii TaxID=2023184 RepID=A0A5F2BKB9_9LEPT|nr:chromosome partitioning protein ParB [Leptospira barantonii]TGM06011.1 chromosome partitioning protein ParB [Leptospira barantonii]
MSAKAKIQTQPLRKTGTSTYLLSKMELSPELLEVQGYMPISTTDYNNLLNSVSREGIKDPLRGYFDSKRIFQILGGANRLQAGLESGKTDAPIEIYEGGTWNERVEFCLDDNLNRRHFTTNQKRTLIELKLKLNPANSDREIASSISVDHKTVGSVRKQLISTGEIPQLANRIGSDGKRRSSGQNVKKPISNETALTPKEEISILKKDLKGLNTQLKNIQKEIGTKETRITELQKKIGKK